MTTLEWFGWTFYFHTLIPRFRLRWRSDPLVALRILLILSSFATSALLWRPGEMFASAAGYHYIRLLIGEDTLGFVFTVHGFGLLWRLLAVRLRFGWTAIFGVIGIVLYFGIPICVFMDLGRLTMAGISMMTLGTGCWWIVARGPFQIEGE